MSGFFAIGVSHPKVEQNIGTLLRSAHLYGAAFVFTIGRRYRRQATDTPKTPQSTPLLHFTTVDDLHAHLPDGAPLVGVELDPRAVPLSRFVHPPRAVYLLGAEDHGLTADERDRCHHLVQIESARPQSMNVASAGTVLLYTRHTSSRQYLAAIDRETT